MIYFEGEKNNIIVSYNFNITSIWLQYERGKINKIIITQTNNKSSLYSYA